MYIITDSKSNMVINWGEVMNKQNNMFILENENLAYPMSFTSCYEIDSLIEGLAEGKYCYSPEKGFYENPDWIEPGSDIPEEIKETIRQEYRDELAQEVSQNVYGA